MLRFLSLSRLCAVFVKISTLWPGFAFCDGDQTNAGKVDARGSLGVPQDYTGMVGLTGGGGGGGVVGGAGVGVSAAGHLYAQVAPQDSKLKLQHIFYTFTFWNIDKTFILFPFSNHCARHGPNATTSANCTNFRGCLSQHCPLINVSSSRR